MELVEGALGESADFLIATYGMDAAHQDSLKPTAFNTSRQAKLEESVSTLGLQDKVQVGPRWFMSVCAQCCVQETDAERIYD